MPRRAKSATMTRTVSESPAPRARKVPARCNSLDGKRWLLNSLSLWSDLRKTAEETRLKHPAQFPVTLASRLIESFLPDGNQTILDPFCGSGSTLVAAGLAGKQGIGIELSADYVALSRQRLLDQGIGESQNLRIHHGRAEQLEDVVSAESIDLCVTSPPYWNILGQKRTADSKHIRHYGNLPGDLSLLPEYEHYLQALCDVFAKVFRVLKPGAHCAIVVMDLRKRDQFFPLHSDLGTRLRQVGYRWDDLIIWNRQAEYNNLRPLGYPAVFRVNKIHEYIVLMQKPRSR